MASVQDIKRRIRSVRNTRKITKAMELVAAARLRRAEERIRQMRPYADRMQELMVGTARAASSLRGLPLLQRREREPVAIVPLTGDRGLAGAFNAPGAPARVRARAEPACRGQEVRWLVVGKKGRSTLGSAAQARAGVDGFTDQPAYADAQAIAHRLAELYADGEIDRVGRRLQPLRVAARPARRPSRRCCRSPRGAGAARGQEDEEHEAPARRLHLRARARGDPRAAAAGLRRDGDLPRAARVGGVGARRADDRDAQRVEERGRADRPPDARR